MDEIWKPVPDYPAYEVSNFGRVKSFWFSKPRILKPILGHGYLYVNLCKADKSKQIRKQISIHRLVATAFIPNPSGKREVNHIDGNKSNNHVSNLEWATSSENERHAVAMDLIKQGEEHHRAKLTNEQAYFIRENPDGLTTCELAEMFGVAHGTISDIQLGKRYRNVGGVTRQAYSQPRNKIPDKVRNQIKAEYVFKSKEFSSYALAKKYGVSHQTILNIIHESS